MSNFRRWEKFPDSLSSRNWLSVRCPEKLPDRLKFSSSYRLRNSRPSLSFSDRLKYPPRSQIFLWTSPPPGLSRPTTPPPTPVRGVWQPITDRIFGAAVWVTDPGGPGAICASSGLRKTHTKRYVNAHMYKSLITHHTNYIGMGIGRLLTDLTISSSDMQWFIHVVAWWYRTGYLGPQGIVKS